MSKTCLNRPEIITVSSGMLAGLALHIQKGHQWHDSFCNKNKRMRRDENEMLWIVRNKHHQAPSIMPNPSLLQPLDIEARICDVMGCNITATAYQPGDSNNIGSVAWIGWCKLKDRCEWCEMWCHPSFAAHTGVGASVPPGVPEVLQGPFPVYQCHPIVRSSSGLAIQCHLVPLAIWGLSEASLRIPLLQHGRRHTIQREWVWK
jgi:hypothetical protein